MPGPPLVTGISPNEGHPATRVTIRGDNLGGNHHDLLSILINDEECIASAEWHSVHRITARCGRSQGAGPVIVTTRSGGRGTCTVNFRIYMTRIGLTTEVAYWYDEAKQWEARRGRIMGIGDSPTPEIKGTDDANPLGLDDPGEVVHDEEQLMQMFPEGSGDLSLENFSPAWYILEHHSTASLRDLERALRHREEKKRKERETSTNDMVLYVKDFLLSFFECVDTLDHLNSRVGDDKRVITKTLDDLDSMCTQTEATVNNAFGVIFLRRRQIESLKCIMSSVGKFAYLWDTLASINRNHESANYRLLIGDYRKLKVLLEEVPSEAFRRVVESVDEEMNRLYRQLDAQLMQMPGALDEQLQFCRFINELGARDEPAWKCLKALAAHSLDHEIRGYYRERTESMPGFTRHGLAASVLGGGTVPMSHFKEATFTIASTIKAPRLFGTAEQGGVQSRRNRANDDDEGEAIAATISPLESCFRTMFSALARRIEHLGQLWRSCDRARAANDEACDEKELAHRYNVLVETLVGEACRHGELLLTNTTGSIKPRQVVFAMREAKKALRACETIGSRGVLPASALRHLRLFIQGAGRALMSAVLRRAVEDGKIACGAAMGNVKALNQLSHMYESLLHKVLTTCRFIVESDDVAGGGEEFALLDRELMGQIHQCIAQLLLSPLQTFMEIGRHEAESGPVGGLFRTLLCVKCLLELENSVIPAVVPQVASILMAQDVAAAFEDGIRAQYRRAEDELSRYYLDDAVETVITELRSGMSEDSGVHWSGSDDPQSVNTYVAQVLLRVNEKYQEVAAVMQATSTPTTALDVDTTRRDGDEDAPTAEQAAAGFLIHFVGGVGEAIVKELNRQLRAVVHFDDQGCVQAHADVSCIDKCLRAALNERALALLAGLMRTIPVPDDERRVMHMYRLVQEFFEKNEKLVFLSERPANDGEAASAITASKESAD